MTAIDQHAAESARRVHDPLSRAAIAAKLQEHARYVAGLLAGLTDSANDRGVRVDRALTSDLCRLEEILTDVAEQISDGDVYASGLKVAA